MRRTLFISTLAALTALMLAAAAPGALAQDSGVDQYLENPGTVPDSTDGGGGGSTGGGGGSTGGGGSGGGSAPAPAPSEPSAGSAPAGGAVEPQGAASGAGTTTTQDTTTESTGTGSGDRKSAKPNEDNQDKQAASDKRLDEITDPVVARAKNAAVEDSGSSGIGIVLPIVLGVLLLAAIVVMVVRRRRQIAHA